ncbi:MAG: GFA family protein [Gammaproteobacteria bacterium]|nr:GFA family protein [Gammaproteobacteria bacterium]
MIQGSCVCKAVRYEAHGRLRDIVVCHCNECRKMSGHFTAATAVHAANLRLVDDSGLRWFRSSKGARRGFCSRCGSTLFWKPDAGDRVSIYAGSIDSTHQLKVSAHIFLNEKGTYYGIEQAQGVAVFPEGGASLNVP